jgi:predicted CXXCH cytochrome family protein
MGLNPGPGLTLPAGTWTEVEFSIRTTVDAAFAATYTLGLAPFDPAVGPPATTRIVMAGAPELTLSPGQLSGIPAGGAAGDGVPAYALVPPAGVMATTADLRSTDGWLVYPLVVTASWKAGATPASAEPAPAAFVSPHGGYSNTPAACADCHRAHSAGLPDLGAGAVTEATICLTCHNGTGAQSDVAAAFGNPAIPANDAAAGAFYRHDALVASSHTSSSDNEFQDPPGTPVLNRHSACGDCHEPHRASGADAAVTPAGWTAPGSLSGISGVAVTNGPAGSAPAYTAWTSSSTAHAVTLEYELCLKCHSGFTELRSAAPDAPSTWALDKGIELNPSNASTHPIEGPGSNDTAAMAASLAGTSPFKQWNFLVGDTVRCVQCHADPTRFSASAPPSAGSDLAPHASENRGILFQPYADRTLNDSTASYDPTSFALCFVCHSEAPFRDATGSPREDTNFQYHGLHVSAIENRGDGGTSIDVSGDGRGNATCAECHFRIHSTALAYRTGDRNNARLVNFAPNVVAGDGAWTSTGIAAGTCTLTCHGASHDQTSTTYAPGGDLVLSIVATPSTFSAAGDLVVLRYYVTNTRSTAVAGPLVVTDPALGDPSCPAGDLAAGATATCMAGYTVTPADVLAGTITTSATAEAGGFVSNTATLTLKLAP